MSRVLEEMAPTTDGISGHTGVWSVHYRSWHLGLGAGVRLDIRYTNKGLA